MRSKLFANLIAVTLIAAAFFVVTSVINLMAATDEVAEQEFSFLKRTGDQHWGDKNWTEAARYYKELAEKDELNIGARMAYAWNLSQQISSELRATTSSDQVELPEELEVTEETKAVARKAIEAYQTTVKSTQFRNISRVQLGWLHGLLGETEMAITYLVKALEDGYQARNMRSYYISKEVLNDPRMQAALAKSDSF